MNEAIAAGILLISIIFIWKLVSNIKIEVTVKMPAISVKAPDIAVTVTPPPINVVEPLKDDLYDEKGNSRVDQKQTPDPMAMFNTVMHGIEEVMRDGDV